MFHTLLAGARSHAGLLVRAMPGSLAASLALIVIGGALEFAVVAALLLVLSSLGLDASGGPAVFVERGTALLSALGLNPGLEVSVAAYAALVVAQALTLRAQTITALGIEYRFVAWMRAGLFESVTAAAWPFIVRSKGTDFSHALTTELDRVGLATYQLLWTLTGVCVLAAQIAVALRVSVPLTLLVAAAGGALAFAVLPAMRGARRGGEAISAANADVHAMAVEQIAGLKTLKSQGLEETSAREFVARAHAVAEAATTVARRQANARAWYEIGAAALLGLVLVAAVRWLAPSPAALVILVYLSARVLPRISALQQGVHQYASALPALSRVVSLREACDAERERIARPGRAPAFTDRIALEHVTFAYEPDRPVLDDVSLTIRRGETTALVGPSGSGKTTVADLVIGLITPQQGAVTIDGSPLDAGLLAAWRASIGYVAQESFFFHDSIRANLLAAAPEASEADIHEALERAACGFVRGLPAGLDTVVGDRGVRLSGGERQRLALARALVRRPQLLILDEATSALDIENEARIMHAIDALRGQLTILLITHRVWTLRRVDTIHVLDAGRLVESGRWDTLSGIVRSRFAALSSTEGALSSPRVATGR
ncbi:MAG TPA: ABC transporter ATP-binding protein [Vicinamibacterales bacterium]